MKRVYKKISLKTRQGFTAAEKLKAKGWKIILVGIDSVLLEKGLIK